MKVFEDSLSLLRFHEYNQKKIKDIPFKNITKLEKSNINMKIQLKMNLIMNIFNDLR